MKRNFLRSFAVAGLLGTAALLSGQDVQAQDYDYRAPSYYVVPPAIASYSLYAPVPIATYAPPPVVVGPAPVYFAPPPVYAPAPIYAPAYPVAAYRPVPYASVSSRWHTGPLGVSHYHYRYNTPVGNYHYNYHVRGGWGW